MKMTGAQILVESLIEQGVDTIFGFPGGAVLNIYDALYASSDRVKHVLCSHEQGAAHAADGYARSTGKTGVVLATSGPGATNLVTGIATAFMDSVPLVALTCNVPLDLIGRDSFQEIDIYGITVPITKHNFFVTDPAELADTVRQAFEIASSGRPGPVLIDIPKDISAKTAEYVPAGRYRLRLLPAPSPARLDAVAEAIQKSARPLIYAGGGVVQSGASEELLALAKRMHSPVSTSIMGLSAVPHDFHLSMGMIGMHGTPASGKAVAECDLLLTIGARFSDRVFGDRSRFAQGATIIHVDIDPCEFDKNIAAAIKVRGDAKEVMAGLLERLEQQEHSEWMHELLRYKALNPLPTPADQQGVQSREILGQLQQVLGEDAIIATDVGQHQMHTAQYYPFTQPRSFLSSCGLGTMGYGMGAAVGAQTGNPHRRVALITGDGSFHMNMSEMATAVTEGLPLLVLVMNNGVLGMVRQWQRLFYDCRYSSTTLNRQTDFVKLAEAFGALGLRIESREQIRPVLEQAAASGRPCVIDCVLDKDASVYPIIPPGKTGHDMIFCD